MQPLTPPDRIRQALEASGVIDDHVQALAVVDVLHGVTAPEEARTAGRHATAFLDAHMTSEETGDGVFDWIAALDGALRPELARLTDEHVRIRQALAALDAAADDEAVTLAHQLATLLESHEAAERVALDRALGR